MANRAVTFMHTLDVSGCCYYDNEHLITGNEGGLLYRCEESYKTGMKLMFYVVLYFYNYYATAVGLYT